MAVRHVSCARNLETNIGWATSEDIPGLVSKLETFEDPHPPSYGGDAEPFRGKRANGHRDVGQLSQRKHFPEELLNVNTAWARSRLRRRRNAGSCALKTN